MKTEGMPQGASGLQEVLKTVREKDVSGMTVLQREDHLGSIRAMKAVLAKEEELQRKFAERRKGKAQSSAVVADAIFFMNS